MRAARITRYGAADAVTITDVPTPVAGAGEVLVRTHATTVDTVDAVARRGTPWFSRLYFGLRRPKRDVLGGDVAGEVVAVGPGVTRFGVGDAVVGSTGTGFASHAEYVVLAESGAVEHVPDGLAYADAVAIVGGPLTALPFLRDHARLRAGQRILINGASGVVGSAAVQLARWYGAHVTAVCRESKHDAVRRLGAEDVLDWTRQDYSRGPGRYDVVFDAAGTSTFGRARRVLTEDGVYLTTEPSAAILVQTALTARLGRRRAAVAFTGLRPVADQASDFATVCELAARGEFVPVVDSRYPFERIVDAHRRVDEGTKLGSVVVTLGPPASGA